MHIGCHTDNVCACPSLTWWHSYPIIKGKHVLSANVEEIIGPKDDIPAVPSGSRLGICTYCPPIARAVRKTLHHEVIPVELYNEYLNPSRCAA